MHRPKYLSRLTALLFSRPADGQGGKDAVREHNRKGKLLDTTLDVTLTSAESNS
ncbi:hypothetical protein WG66_017115 [Moniliophthora roreri]|nr:hypothetical protein WG66_017115 [Moniliophthora roreri]